MHTVQNYLDLTDPLATQQSDARDANDAMTSTTSFTNQNKKRSNERPSTDRTGSIRKKPQQELGSFEDAFES